MGQPLGGHPNTVYGRKVGLPRSVAIGWRATRAITKWFSVTAPLWPGTGFWSHAGFSTRKGSVAGTWPAFRRGWPVRRGVVALGSRRCPPAWGWQRWGFWVGGKGRRATRAWHSSVGSCVCGPLPRPRAFIPPAAQHHAQADLPESGQFWYVGGVCPSVPFMLVRANPRQAAYRHRWAAIPHRIPNRTFVCQCWWLLVGGRRVPSISGV
jgi:hypothetical protein